MTGVIWLQDQQQLLKTGTGSSSFFTYHLWPTNTVPQTWHMRYKYFTACARALLTYFFNRAHWHTINKVQSSNYQDDITSLHLKLCSRSCFQFSCCEKEGNRGVILTPRGGNRDTCDCTMFFYDIPYQPITQTLALAQPCGRSRFQCVRRWKGNRSHRIQVQQTEHLSPLVSYLRVG